MPIWVSLMTRFAAFIVALWMASGASAEARVADRMLGLLDGCRAALLSGDEAAFDGLTLETEMTSEVMIIRGWRGPETAGLTISLMVREKPTGRAGVCDVSFLPNAGDTVSAKALRAMALNLSQSLRNAPGTVVTLRQAGEVLTTCRGGQDISLFIDPESLGVGFAAQIAMAPHKTTETSTQECM